MSEDARLLERRHTYASIAEKIDAIALAHPGRRWFLLLGASVALLLVFVVSIGVVLWRGVGVWGVNLPVAWGFAITNFFWWIAIAHAGTMISAILLLMNQEWRTPIARAAETMTLVALICALVYPLLHLGRPFVFYWLMPYPNAMNLWPQFRSPLVWDVFASIAYGGIVFLFWLVGLIPDFATLRDAARGRWARRVYAVLALGWRGAGRDWIRFRAARRLLAAFAASLVLSIHSIGGLATSIVPGWHSTIFPAYFVAAAVLSGLSMLVIILVPMRAWLSLGEIITARHYDALGMLMLAGSWVVAYGQFNNLAIELAQGNAYERFTALIRVVGTYSPLFWLMIACSVAAPQLFWFRRFRRSGAAVFIISILIATGMWLERFIVVSTSLDREYLPSSWKIFIPTLWDWTTLFGTFGLFAIGVILMLRAMPVTSLSEMRELLTKRGELAPSKNADARPSRHEGPRRYGVIAEFETPHELVDAAAEARLRRYEEFETFTPFPVEGLKPILGVNNLLLGLIAFAGGAGGAVVGFAMQYYASVISYPLNVGGRPFNSWPAFVPVTFYTAILGAALALVTALLIVSRLPDVSHAVFGIPGFERASSDRFFLLIRATDRRFDLEKTRAWLQRTTRGPVREVRW